MQLHMERRQTTQEQDTMEQIAAETGGKAFIETNDFADAVADVVENGSSYYTVAYVPNRKKFDGRFHTFDVRLDKASYKLAYRRGYYADDAEAGTKGAAALAGIEAEDVPEQKHREDHQEKEDQHGECREGQGFSRGLWI